MEGWAEFLDEMKQYYNLDLDCLSGGGGGGRSVWHVMLCVLRVLCVLA